MKRDRTISNDGEVQVILFYLDPVECLVLVRREENWFFFPEWMEQNRRRTNGNWIDFDNINVMDSF